MTALSYDEFGITEPEEGVIQFEILPAHLKLLRALQLEWDRAHWGSLRTRSTRPYGSTDVRADANRILGEDSLTDEAIQILHRGAATALQIALKTGKFKAGLFRAQKYSQDWHEYREKKVKIKDEDTGQVALDPAGGDE